MKVAGFGLPPYFGRTKDGGLTGIDILLAKVLADSLRLKMTFMPTRTWGQPVNETTGEWSGTTQKVNKD